MIRLPAYFTGFGSKADGSAGLRFSTQELSPEDFSTFKECLNAFGWLVFSENPIAEADIPAEEVEDKAKTPSKRLRAVFYKLWVQAGKPQDFEVWYRGKMEGLIEHFKEKLQMP